MKKTLIATTKQLQSLGGDGLKIQQSKHDQMRIWTEAVLWIDNKCNINIKKFNNGNINEQQILISVIWVDMDVVRFVCFCGIVDHHCLKYHACIEWVSP